MSKPRLPWFMLDKETLTDPRLLAMARELSRRYAISRCDDDGSAGEELDYASQLSCMTSACRGAIVMLWSYAHDNIRPDDTLPIDTVTIDSLVGLDGFCSVMPTEWLQILDDGSGVYLPHFIKKNQLVELQKKREADARRHREMRDRKRVTHVTHDESMTSSGHPTDVRRRDRDKDKKEEDPPKAPRKRDQKTLEQALTEARLVPGVDLEAFERWFAYRSQRSPKLQPASWIAAAEDIAALGDSETQRAAVRHSVAASYQGVFPAEKGRATATPGARPTRPTQESALAAIDAANGSDIEDNQEVIRWEN